MQMIEREFGRERTLLPAKIIFNDKQSVIDGVVRNISSGGARLKLTSTLGIPDQFTLYIPRYEKRYLCWIAWSNMTELGVSFSPVEDFVGKPDLRLVKE